MNHLKYAKYIWRHKKFVWWAGRRLGVPVWQLVVHDSSKLSRAEWKPYVDAFFQYLPRAAQPKSVQEAFQRAWRHHFTNNKHHWEYWLPRDGDYRKEETPEPAKMPLQYVREMVADWAGAGRAITGSWDLNDWYEKNKDKIKLHPETRAQAEALMDMFKRYLDGD